MPTIVDAALGRVKWSGEQFRISWDFANDLEDGDSVSVGAVTARDDADGTDVSGTLIQGVGVSGTHVVATLKAGTVGHSYRITFKATTTPGADVFQRVLRVSMADL